MWLRFSHNFSLKDKDVPIRLLFLDLIISYIYIYIKDNVCSLTK